MCEVGNVIITASLDAISGLSVTVPYTVSGTATGSGTDHDLANGNITITAGQLTGTVTFAVTDDGDLESAETVIATMGTPINAVKGVTNTIYTVSINDNDGANNAPVLAWVGSGNYASDGVNPNSDADGSSFEFQVSYTDDDDEAPSTIEVWVDTDNNGSFAAGEKYAMTEVDGGDTSYTNGKLYSKTLPLSLVGDGVVDYEFHASDGISSATGGAPVGTGGTLNVVDPLSVPGEYASVAAAITAASSGDVITVAAGTYSENIDFGGRDITIKSVSGAGSTTLQGDGSDNPVITFAGGESSSAILDGFTINNQKHSSTNAFGIKISNCSAPTIKNSLIQGNITTTSGSAVFIDGGGGTIENTTIGGSGTGNTASQHGSAIYFINSCSELTVTDSFITHNTSTYNQGGGVHLNTNAHTATFTNSSIEGGEMKM